MDNKFKYENSYIEPFWVGLLEADGTINVVQRGHKFFFRICISLKNLPSNVDMLQLLQKFIGGRVVIERQDQYVTWIASSKDSVDKCIDSLKKYPLLTIRKQCQLNFMLECRKFNQGLPSEVNLYNFKSLRDAQYSNMKNIRVFKDPSVIDSTIKSYFPAWLSGFIEGEGHFILLYFPDGKLKSLGFNIGQNTDIFILEMIRYYFKSTNKILTDKIHSDKKFIHYRLNIYNAKFRSLAIQHFNSYPLLGNKNFQYTRWLQFMVDRGIV